MRVLVQSLRRLCRFFVMVCCFVGTVYFLRMYFLRPRGFLKLHKVIHKSNIDGVAGVRENCGCACRRTKSG